MIFCFHKLGTSLCCSHVYRSRPQSRLAPGHPVARELPRGGQGQEAHAVEPLRLAARADRRLQGTAQRRHRYSQGPGCHYHHPLVAAWSCRRGPRHRAQDRPRSVARPGRQPLPRPHPGPGAQPHPRSRVQACRRRALSPDTATSSLGEQLGLGLVDENELYSALDWLAVRQPAGEAALAKRHLSGGTLVLYDVSSSYLEGRCCPLAQFGYSRDGKRGKRQIVYGLLCARDGCPVAIEVFAGSTADPTTLTSQVTKLKERFALDHVVLVGDRGMITQARITEDIKAAGLDWITALRAPAIKALLEGGALQMSLFDDRDMAGITSPEFPGERLIVCRNRALAGERARKREDLLAATERDLARIAAAVARKRQPLRGKAEIGLEIGAVLDKHKMAKHFALDIIKTTSSFAENTAESSGEPPFAGLYVVRTSMPAAALDDTATVRSYKSLSLVERAFRCIKTVDLQIRPIYHWLADRVRAHVFVCMLAYYLEWHMRQRLAPMLYDDTDKDAGEAQRSSIVAKAERSPAAVTKQTTGRTEDGLPVHSFRTLLAALATLTRNTLVTAIAPEQPFTLTARPTPIQQKARDLLGLSRTQ